MDIVFNETGCFVGLEVTVAMWLFQFRTYAIVIPGYIIIKVLLQTQYMVHIKKQD